MGTGVTESNLKPKFKTKWDLVLVCLCTCLGLSFAHADDKELCPRIFLKQGSFRLNKNERIMVCGDNSTSGWKDVPLEQAQIELKALFQRDGYFSPRFEIKDEKMFIEMGDVTKIKNWNLTGDNTVVDQSRKRKVINQAMTPAKMNEIEKWVESELKSQGYACPVIQTKAQVWNQGIESSYKTGPKQNFVSLQRQDMANLKDDAFKRFEAFEMGELYDNRKLQITSNRLLSDGLAQSSYFTQTCGETGVELVHHVELGEPRLLRIAFGASTEEFPFLDAWFKNTRIDGMASSYWLLLHASPRIQSLEGSSELYILPFSRRTFVGPRFRVARNVEDAYEALSGKTGIDIGRYWDTHGLRFEARVGPTANYVNTIAGFGPDDVSYLTLEGSASLMNNDYEITGVQQDSGYRIGLQYQGQREGVGSPLTADRWTVNAKNLWNVQELSPPLLVLGSRFEGSVTTSDALGQSDERASLPQEYRISLGGEENLRGFTRQALNNGGLGYLTSAYLGLELRLIEELPYNLEPLILWDGATVGKAPWHWDGPVFEDYGVGMRWKSPLGPIRFTVAKGQIHNNDEASGAVRQQWVFLFSFGREF